MCEGGYLNLRDDSPSCSIIAKVTVMALARDLGFEPLDAGPLSMARYTEPFAMLWIKLALVQGLGRRFAFRLLQR